MTFYHAEHSCRLATTYRSLPNEATNDTIKQTLGSQIEASCTTNANDASSRMHLIDGSVVTGNPSPPKTAAYNFSHLQRSWTMLQARRALSNCRSRHPDISVGGLETGAPFPGLSYYIAHALLAVSFCRCLIRQRYPTTEFGPASIWQTLFVVIQVLIGGSTTRVVGIISLHGLIS